MIWQIVLSMIGGLVWAFIFLLCGLPFWFCLTVMAAVALVSFMLMRLFEAMAE